MRAVDRIFGDDKISSLEQPDLIDAAEVAAILKMSKRHVAERLVYEPTFPKWYRPGRERLWDRDEVLKWLASTRGR